VSQVVAAEERQPITGEQPMQPIAGELRHKERTD